MTSELMPPALAAIAIFGAAACGAKVIVDGTGGAASTSTSSSSSSSTPVTCLSDTCMETTITCVCKGTCAGHAASTVCTYMPSGSTCNCIWEGNAVGSCTLAPDQVCNIDGSCCKAVFGF